jgi:hypothetical protein
MNLKTMNAELASLPVPQYKMTDCDEETSIS